MTYIFRPALRSKHRPRACVLRICYIVRINGCAANTFSCYYRVGTMYMLYRNSDDINKIYSDSSANSVAELKITFNMCYNYCLLSLYKYIVSNSSVAIIIQQTTDAAGQDDLYTIHILFKSYIIHPIEMKNDSTDLQ